MGRRNDCKIIEVSFPGIRMNNIRASRQFVDVQVKYSAPEQKPGNFCTLTIEAIKESRQVRVSTETTVRVNPGQEQTARINDFSLALDKEVGDIIDIVVKLRCQDPRCSTSSTDLLRVVQE